MVGVRVEKAFVRVLNALAELEALSSMSKQPGDASGEAIAGTGAWVGRLHRRLDRYLTLTSHLHSHQVALSPDLIRALQMRVKDAVDSGEGTAVFAAAADLREELTAHFRALSLEPPRSSL